MNVLKGSAELSKQASASRHVKKMSGRTSSGHLPEAGPSEPDQAKLVFVFERQKKGQERMVPEPAFQL
jgi:hypothetical protein